MIIWIASYPKSGNTYLRSFLASYYFSKKGKFDFKLLMNILQFPSIRFSQKDFLSFEDAAKNWIPNQRFFFEKEKLFFLKTHNTLNKFNNFESRFNSELCDLKKINLDSEDDKILYRLIEKHFKETNSPLAQKMLKDWKNVTTKFKKVVPRDYEKALEKLNKKHEVLIN